MIHDWSLGDFGAAAGFFLFYSLFSKSGQTDLS